MNARPNPQHNHPIKETTMTFQNNKPIVAAVLPPREGFGPRREQMTEEY